jgi:hypothetical protein
MNSKLCKRLRSLAQKETVGLPNVAYNVIRHPKQNPKFNPVDPISLEPFTIDKLQFVLDPKCTRSVYQKLKAAAK